MAAWTEAIRVAPEDASSYLARADVRSRLGQFPEALADCQLACDLPEFDQRDESLLQQRADLYAALERSNEAAADQIAILQIRRKSPNWTTGPEWKSDRSKFLICHSDSVSRRT